VIAGAVEAAATAFQRLALHRIEWVSYDFPWMTPAAFLLLVVPATLGVYALSWIVRRRLSLPNILGLLVAVLVFSLLLPYTVIAWWASGLLALGLGVQLSRLARRARTDRWLRILQGTALALVAVMALAGVAIRVSRAWTEHHATATLPAGGDGPNVLLIVLDTVRSSNLSLYGYDRPTTPELQRWAADATVFDQAIATAPWTLPSHASLFTGRPASSLGASWRTPLPGTFPTVAEILESRGYATGGFVSNLLYTSYESGLTRGFVHYDDYRLSWPLVFLHSPLMRIGLKVERPQARSWQEVWRALAASHIEPDGLEPADVFRPADRVAAAFLDWQATVTGRPFFAFLNFYDAHAPYRAPDSFLKAFWRAKHPGLSEDYDRYDAAIAWLDHVTGMLLQTLQDRGVLDRTIVVVVSDHGEQFGEHGLIDHANSLYLPLLHVPLMIRYPAGAPSGERVRTLVSLRDVPATILDLAGIADREVPGTSLSGSWRQPGAPVQGDVIAELSKGINVMSTARNFRGDVVSRMDERFHYVRSGDGTEEIFDYRADPHELQNLVSDQAVRPDLVRLRAGFPIR
jgi:arylsulfatase A-like enzyme